MSTKCLVTELNGVVDNENLLKVGEFAISLSPDSTIRAMQITFGINDTVLRITGEGYFTNKSKDNLGKTFLIKSGTITSFYVSNTECKLIVPNKENLLYLSLVNIENASFDISALKYTQIATLHLTKQCFGDIENISDKTNMNSLVVGGATGRIESLSKLVNLNYLQSSTLTGDLGSTISTMSSISNLNLNGSKGLYGDISKAPKSLSYMGNDFSGSFSWKGERDSSYPIISMVGGFVFGEDLDAMLINQAKCQVTNETYKIIQVRGTKTSASDEAISTLQSKGYSVYIQ